MDRLTERISRLSAAERWTLLMTLARRNQLEVSSAVAEIERSRPQQDIQVNAWSINGLDEQQVVA